MLKFLLGKGQQHAAERQRLQKELFAYRKTAQHGFPHKPSALAYDAVLKLMAIGTQTGAIKIFGQAGVEFYGQHILMNNSAAELNVRLIEWVTGTGRLLSLTAANQLILWEPVGFTLMAIKSMLFDNELKKISSVCCSINTDIIWIGTEAGHVYQFDLNTFDVTGIVIYNDAVMGQVPPTYKLNPGAIEAVRQIPNDQNKLLIAYNRGLCVLWDIQNELVTRAYIAPGHGQSVGLYINAAGTQFTWYHADGSFATWNLTNGEPPRNVNYVPYGPDPCKSIDRLYIAKRGDIELSIFSGGMPRSAYGDHNCVSIHSSNGHKICLDFTSKIIDFFVTYQGPSPSDEAEVLIVLLEEELCAYDLTRPDTPPIKAPYLHSIHASAVTCNYLASQVSQDVYNRIYKSGLEQDRHYSGLGLTWPINGGNISNRIKNHDNDSSYNDADDGDDNNWNGEYDLLLTGHEDGSVKFWNCTGVALQPIYHFKTALLYGSENDDNEVIGENTESLDPSEPPFRKAGLFDPYSDDPRLAIKKIAFCSKTGRLIVGGTAGQIVVACFLTDNDNNDINASITTFKYCSMNLVSDRDGFVWKGHDQLNVRPNLLSPIAAEVIGDKGVCITGVVQVLPPASITCLALESNWGLLAGGTAHGLILFDFQHFLPIYHRCTLNPNDLTGAGELLSRRKSFKKSLRESFRKLRKGRSTRSTHAKNQVSTTLESRPIERQVEARSADDGMGSMVRCLLFAKTYITNFHTTSPTLWSATNASTVSVFLLNLPSSSNSGNTSTIGGGDVAPTATRTITAQFVKQLRLKHGAPVVGIAIFDSTGFPVDQLGGTNSGTPPHHVLIASEEQFKIFSLPQLKPLNKYKLTANEGARVRRIHFATFKCRVPPEIVQGLTGGGGGNSPTKSSRFHDQQQQQQQQHNAIEKSSDLYQEMALICLTNLGDIMVLSVPELKRQLNAAAVRREDINGICSLCFTSNAEALYMMSSSELQRISLANSKVTTPMGQVNVTPLQGSRSIADKTEQEEQEQNETERDSVPVHYHHQNQGPIKTTAATASTIKASLTSPVYKKPIIGTTKTLEVNVDNATTINGVASTDNSSNDNSPNRNANETISSSVGDITVDSVRDYLNATTTTLCSTTTEETVGRLSVLSTQTNQTLNTIKMKEHKNENIPSVIELVPPSSTTETNTSSVVIKSIITSVSHEKTNGETEIVTTRTSTHEESQF